MACRSLHLHLLSLHLTLSHLQLVPPSFQSSSLARSPSRVKCAQIVLPLSSSYLPLTPSPPPPLLVLPFRKAWLPSKRHNQWEKFPELQGQTDARLILRVENQMRRRLKSLEGWGRGGRVVMWWI